MGWRETLASLFGISAFVNAPQGRSLGDPEIDDARSAAGDQLQPIPLSQTRWYQRDLETATLLADAGDLSMAARLMRAARSDGILAGVLSTRTAGVVRLPKRFRGDPDLVAELERVAVDDDVSSGVPRSIFDEMFPPSELALLAADGELLGVGVAELVPVIGREHPVLVRLDPEFLVYRWNEGRWYFRSRFGLLPITPGDGRWILHTPGGRVAPWQHALWRAIGRAYIRKEHAQHLKDNWESKLANPARVAVAPQGAAEKQKDGWFRRVMAWGVNTVFGMTPGYDVKLLESNGRGAQSFDATIKAQNEEFVISVAGQTVTTDGGAGFQNSDIHKSIRADLIKATADGLAYTINTQGLPVYTVIRRGVDAIPRTPVVEWDVTPPKDRTAEATALSQLALAMEGMTRALAPHGVTVDVRALLDRFAVPVTTNPAEAVSDLARVNELARAAGLRPTAASVRALLERGGIELEELPQGQSDRQRLELAPTDLAKVVKAVEARAAAGLGPFGDERDEKTVTELGALAERVAEDDDAPSGPKREAA